MIRILSLDGGGMLGLIEAMVLQELERRTGAKAGRLFDMIAGTSTGGIIALGLTVPECNDGEPRYSAADLVELYRLEGENIFGPRTRRLLGPIIGPKYSDKGLKDVLGSYFGATRLSQAITDVIVPTYDLTLRKPKFFKSWYARKYHEEDWYMTDVARATASAPTYLPPATIRSVDGGRTMHLWDGGLAANSPAMCAFAEVSRYSKNAEVILVSLGAGNSATGIDHKAASRYGMIRLASSIISTALDGPMDAVDYQCHEIVGPRQYWRLNPRLEKNIDRMDDARPEHLKKVEEVTADFIATHTQSLDMIARLLTGHKPKGENVA